MNRSLAPEFLQQIAGPLQRAHQTFDSIYRGPRGDRQPVHTVYGGAHLFHADIAKILGEKALQALDEYAPDFITFAKAIGFPSEEFHGESPNAAAAMEAIIQEDSQRAQRDNRPAWLAYTIYKRVREKLQREPVEDFRIDFEDGFGNRSDEEEDRYAMATASEIAAGMHNSSLPPFVGLRIKPFTEEFRNRSVRTLDIFLTHLLAKTNRNLPANFFITLPKVTIPEESASLAAICSRLESTLDLKKDTLRMEIMIETPQSIFNAKGEMNLLALVMAAQGRCVGAHFGTYDFTAGRGITAAHQHMKHFACDFAREAMQLALAGTGIWLSDGGTNLLPVALHDVDKEVKGLTAVQTAENHRAVHHAWKLHFQHVRHSLMNGYYQGWDLHPAQLVTRYAAVYSFFLESLDTSSERLRNFIEKTAQTTLTGEVFDDAATGQGLLNYFLRAVNCGAITEQEARALTTLTPTELRSSSFIKILDSRRR